MRAMAAGPSTTGRPRRIAFDVWAAILPLCFGVVLVGLTVLTIGVRLAGSIHTWICSGASSA